jgi:signal transduction histidine kinase/ActR/RegA family two-component response regulator
MKIRSQLALLVVAVVVPVGLLAAATTARLWQLQREAYEQRYLERVSALRLALDTRLEATTRVLRALSSSNDLEIAELLPRFVERFDHLLESNPEWAAVGLCDAAGNLVAAKARPGLPPIPPPLRAPADGAGSPAFSDQRAVGADTFVTYVSVPIVRNAASRGFIYVAITQQGWLDFLRGYPVSDRATLTLNDREGMVLARTLNNERWVGKRSGASFLDRTQGKDEGSFQSAGLEGQRFYSAFSRSRQSGWMLSTGVPREEVEASLRDSTVAIIASVVATAVVVALFAIWLGSRIIGAITALALAARRVATPEVAAPDAVLPIDEVESVRLALQQAAAMLAARDADRAIAYAREAEARAEAERSNAAKDEVLAMLGHELRNPLSAMKSASALLATPGAEPAAQARSREVIERQVRRLTDLVDDMLDVARLNSGKIVLDRRVVDMAEVARHVVGSFQDAGRSLHVRVAAQLDPAWVYADETRLEQVIANLFDNACKYTRHGGTVRIETGTSDDGATLTVGDDGSGIAPDLLPRIFDVFAQGERTLERSQGGLGLGLTVVRRLVALHGGSIVAESAGLQRGATFRVRLPVATASQREVATPPPTPPGLPPLHIVVVEDNVDNRELMTMLLGLDGHTVTAVGDGESGVAAIVAERPTAAIVDLGLPGIDGLEVARRVRAGSAEAHTLLFAVTGYGAPEDRERALSAGFDGFLVKPFDVEAFNRLVAEDLAQRVPAPPR